MSNTTFIILNPSAKGEHARGLISRIKVSFPQSDLKITKKAGDAEFFAAEAVRQGASMIIAAGGDGTINEVVNGMAGSQIPLGILPVGSMNVFAMELGIPEELEEAIAVIRRGKRKKVDLAQANGRCFVQLAGVGLDAHIVKKTSLESKKVFGPMSYLFTLIQMARYKSPKITVSAPRHHHVRGAFVVIGNGRFYGGPFKLFPHGKINDGKFDVCIFKKIGYFDILRYFQGVLLGTHLRFKDVVYFQAEKLDITSHDPIPFEVDGELCGETPVQFTMQKHGLIVFVAC